MPTLPDVWLAAADLPEAISAMRPGAVTAEDSWWMNLLEGDLALPDWSILAAVGLNGLSGAAFGARRGFDVIGVLGLAVAQGLGGLILLSLLLQLGVPFVLADPIYISVVGIAGLLGFFFAAAISQALRLAILLDGLAVGFLCTVGVSQALNVKLEPVAAVFLGVLTATGGLIIRDILAGIAPQVLRPGVWLGVTALIGSILYVTLIQVGANRPTAQVVTVLTVGGLRMLAVLRGWRTHRAHDVSGKVWDYWEQDR